MEKLSLMRCGNCMKNIDGILDDIWRNRIGHKEQKGVYCSQECAIKGLDNKQEVSGNSSHN